RPAATLRGHAPVRALPWHRARTRLRQHRGPAAGQWRSQRRHPRGRGRPLLVLNRMNTMTSTFAALLAVALVYKDPYCGCCNAWIEHMRQAGFQVEARNENDMGPVKARAGVPRGKGSCPTAVVGGYFIEGQVPAADVKRLLAARPDAKGLLLPGMPMGSPGMEMPDGSTQPYTVELVAHDGSTTPYARH